MPRRINEERTRKEMKVPLFFGGIDPQLERAGWYLRDDVFKSLPSSWQVDVNVLQGLQVKGGDELSPALRFGDASALMASILDEAFKGGL